MHRTMLVQWRLVPDGEGPQGGWKCTSGHSGWVWPSECLLLDEGSSMYWESLELERLVTNKEEGCP